MKERKGTHQDYEKAFKLFRRAARQDLYQAETRIGYMHINSPGVEKSVPEGIRYFRNTGYKGAPLDQYFLGKSYLNGNSVEQDFLLAAKWLKRAAKQGNVDAANALASLQTNRSQNNDQILNLLD